MNVLFVAKKQAQRSYFFLLLLNISPTGPTGRQECAFYAIEYSAILYIKRYTTA